MTRPPRTALSAAPDAFPETDGASEPMTLYQITVYHNNDSQSMPYEDGHRLTATVSHWRDLPAATEPEALADWAWHVFNADLDLLEPGRSRLGGELVLAACAYRLLRLRSGRSATLCTSPPGAASSWLACEPAGWRSIGDPSNRDSEPLTATKVYRAPTGPATDAVT